MNMFRKKIFEVQADRCSRQGQIRNFSDRLQRVMRLSGEELKLAYDGEISWDINGFTIFVNTHPWNNWKPILEAVPIGLDGAKVGYSNTVEGGFIPASWHYIANGTATEILPPAEVQDIIINRILKI